MIGFATPWLLWGLAALPVIWLLLRAVPPAALRKRFPAVDLLLGLQDKETTTARTPWWLLLLRSVALALLIIGFAGPGAKAPTTAGTGPLLIAVDGTWASARDWPARRDIITQLINDARSRPVAVVMLSDPGPDVAFGDAAGVLERVPAMAPRPWGISMPDWLTQDLNFETVWLSEGVEHPVRADVLTALRARGPVRVIEPVSPLVAITALRAEGEDLILDALRLGALDTVKAQIIGPDPAGVVRVLHSQDLAFDAPDVSVKIDIPHELGNRLRRVEILGQHHAGAVHLLGDSVRRPRVALVQGGGVPGGQALLDPLHYLRESLRPQAQLIEVPLLRALDASADVIILSDVVNLAALEQDRLRDWITAGGTLIRFAGPATASADLTQDPFLPVALRAGGRSIGGAMSWGSPKSLAPFDTDGIFAGLMIPEDVQVQTQVLAQPGPDLVDHVAAELADGTPLVTRAPMGQGQMVLFHSSSDAEWSSLPLSGLFPQMLARLIQVTDSATAPEAGIWTLDQVLDAGGELAPAPAMAPVPAAQLSQASGPDLPPGLYSTEDQRWPVNVLRAGDTIAPAAWPAGMQVDTGLAQASRPLAGWAIAAGVAILALDIVASLAVAGRLLGIVIALALVPHDPAQAQTALDATRQVTIGHVLTGDPKVDDLAEAGLTGLGQILRQRTTIETGPPIGVDIEADELAFFPVLYWPVIVDQALPSVDAIAKLRTYVQQGGMIVFDTRDGDIAGIVGNTPEAERLRVLAAPLGLPGLEPVPSDHVLTRSFYLLEEMPGRYRGDVWVEASPNLPRADGVPFARGNDGVTPVVISGNDWIGAWALDQAGNRLLPVGSGTSGERQREIAYRFGVNLMMYALTGNYKSDQVHVPALLERLEEN